MAVISKQLFYEKIGPHINCHHVIHPWSKNCLQSLPYFVQLMTKGVAQFFLPIYCLKFLTDKDKKDAQYLRRFVIEYLRSIAYAAIFAYAIVGGNCLLSNLFGRLHYYNVGMLTGLISGVSIFIETLQNQKLDSLIFFNLLIEALINNATFFKYFTLGKIKETAIFMVTSSVLMYLLKNSTKRISPLFWFYIPTNKPHLNKNENCNHDKNNNELKCLHYWFHGFRKFFAIGFSLNILRSLIPTFGKILKKPKFILNLILKKSNVKFGLFVGGYVTVYRMVSCWLFQLRGKKELSYDPAISGLLSGLTYFIEPRINVLAIAISTMLQNLYCSSDLLCYLNDILPLRCFLLMFCNALLLHNRIFCLATCPKYYVNLTNIASNGWGPVMYKNLVSQYIVNK